MPLIFNPWPEIILKKLWPCFYPLYGKRSTSTHKHISAGGEEMRMARWKRKDVPSSPNTFIKIGWDRFDCSTIFCCFTPIMYLIRRARSDASLHFTLLRGYNPFRSQASITAPVEWRLCCKQQKHQGYREEIRFVMLSSKKQKHWWCLTHTHPQRSPKQTEDTHKKKLEQQIELFS